MDVKLRNDKDIQREFNLQECIMIDIQSLVKYLLEGAAVAAAAYYIPRKSTNLREIGLIALTAAAVFAVLDTFAPVVSGGARQGAGFGIGYNITSGLEGFCDDEKVESESDSDSDSDSDDSDSVDVMDSVEPLDTIENFSSIL